MVRRPPPLIPQPDAISCGPSVIAMVASDLLRQRGTDLALDVADIGVICGTDAATGTTHERLARGLRAFGISHERHVGDRNAPEAIAVAVDGGRGLAVLRTLTRGVPHWILCHAFGDGQYDILDPWLGDYGLTRQQLVERISPRDWEWHDVQRDQGVLDLRIVEVGTPALRKASLEMVEQAFRSVAGPEPSWVAQYTDTATDWGVSRGLVADGRLVGCYLLRPSDICRTYGVAGCGSDMDELLGVEGVALVVSPEEQGKGYGALLRSMPRRMGFDYVFGQQMKSLGNLDQWLRHRELVADLGNSWLTAEVFRAPRAEVRFSM